MTWRGSWEMYRKYYRMFAYIPFGSFSITHFKNKSLKCKINNVVRGWHLFHNHKTDIRTIPLGSFQIHWPSIIIHSLISLLYIVVHRYTVLASINMKFDNLGTSETGWITCDLARRNCTEVVLSYICGTNLEMVMHCIYIFFLFYFFLQHRANVCYGLVWYSMIT